MLQLDVDTHTLPVCISGVEHSASMEFVCGLSLFSLVSRKHIDISMFGATFPVRYMDPNTYGHFVHDPSSDGKYYVTSGNAGYKFCSLDFVSGFEHGATLTGVAIHPSWWMHFTCE